MFTPVIARAQAPTPPASLDARIEALERKILELESRETISSGFIRPIQSPSDLLSQLGPVASKVYFDASSEWHLGMSSEVFTFQERKGASGSEEAVNRANVLSVSPVLAFRMHPRVIFNSQFLFENGGAESSGSVALQKGQSVVTQAYVDWLTSEDAQAGLRVGHQLIPIGWVNTRNEPVTYLSVLRPELERELIPSPWHENGVSFWIDRPRADIQVGVFNSLDAREYDSDTFIAGGRGQGQNAAADDLMVTLRMNLKLEWFLIGGSLAFGNSAQGDPGLRNSAFNLGELHARLRWARFEFFGQLARGQVNDAEAISIVNAQTIGQMARGHSAQVSYDLIGDTRELWAFARYSAYNLHEQVADGYSPDPELDKKALVVGLSYFPLPYLSLKSDYTFRGNAASTGSDEFALGLAVVY